MGHGNILISPAFECHIYHGSGLKVIVLFPLRPRFCYSDLQLRICRFLTGDISSPTHKS